MTDLITIDEAREQIRGTSADDAWLAIWIPIVSQAIADWLKDPWRLYVPEIDSSGVVVVDSSGDPVPTTVFHPAVRGAALVEIASQYAYREGGGNNDMSEGGRSIDGRGYGYTLNRASTGLLAALRKSTIA